MPNNTPLALTMASGLKGKPCPGAALPMLGKGSQTANGLLTAGLLGAKAAPPMVVRPPHWLDVAGKGQLCPAGTLPALSSSNWGGAAPSQGTLEQDAAMSFPSSNLAMPGILAPGTGGILDATGMDLGSSPGGIGLMAKGASPAVPGSMWPAPG